MKAAIPVKNLAHLCTMIADDFRDADAIVIYDAATNVSDTFDVSSFSKRGVLTDSLLELSVDSVIVGTIMPLAKRAFDEAGISCRRTCGRDLPFNLRMFRSGNLPVMQSHEALPSTCSPSACASCSSSCKGV